MSTCLYLLPVRLPRAPSGSGLCRKSSGRFPVIGAFERQVGDHAAMAVPTISYAKNYCPTDAMTRRAAIAQAPTRAATGYRFTRR